MNKILNLPLSQYTDLYNQIKKSDKVSPSSIWEHRTNVLFNQLVLFSYEKEKIFRIINIQKYSSIDILLEDIQKNKNEDSKKLILSYLSTIPGFNIKEQYQDSLTIENYGYIFCSIQSVFREIQQFEETQLSIIEKNYFDLIINNNQSNNELVKNYKI